MTSLSQYYEESPYPLQNGVLNAVKSCGTRFYLTGGTALSRAYYHHRYSDDLDFFVNDDPDFDEQVDMILGKFRDEGFVWDTATETEKYACVNLERDHRTALMYAAENASPPVIEAIIVAGADIAAKDTKGNTAAWYFERNKKIVDSTIRERLLKLLGG